MHEYGNMEIAAVALRKGLKFKLLLSGLKFRIPYYLGSYVYAEVVSRSAKSLTKYNKGEL